MNDRLPILAAAAALCCGIGLGPTAVRAAPLSSSDRDFLVGTAQGTTYELAAAKLALTKATRADIRSYAHAMIADHSSLDPKLHQLAQRDRVQLPTAMTDDKQKSLDRLQSLAGTAFDSAFVDDVTADNKNDVLTEEKEIQATDDARVKALVERLRQVDTKHARLGEALRHSGQ